MLRLRGGRGVGLVDGSAGGREEQGVERIRARDALGGRPGFRGLCEALRVELAQDLFGADATAFAGRRQDSAHFLLFVSIEKKSRAKTPAVVSITGWFDLVFRSRSVNDRLNFSWTEAVTLLGCLPVAKFLRFETVYKIKTDEYEMLNRTRLPS